MTFIDQILKKVDEASLTHKIYVEELENIFVVPAFMALSKPDVLPDLFDALSAEYNRNRMWFGFDLIVWINDYGNIYDSDIKPSFDVDRYKNIKLVPTKKRNILTGLREYSQICKDGRVQKSIINDKYLHETLIPKYLEISA